MNHIKLVTFIFTGLLGIVGWNSSFAITKQETASGTSQQQIVGTFGDGIAAYSLGQFEKAKKIWLVLAEKGHAEAAFRLARMMDRNNDPDRALMLKYYEMAMINGFDAAVLPWFKIKNGMQSGKTNKTIQIKAVLDLALTKINHLVEKGNGPAMVELGLCLVNETCGLNTDYERALSLFKRSLTVDLISYDKAMVQRYISSLEQVINQ